MKLTWFTLPVVLAAAIAGANGSRVPAALNSISPRSQIEAIVHSYKGGAATATLLAGGMRKVSQRAPANLLRSMWGQ
jgi:hypothetical protein